MSKSLLHRAATDFTRKHSRASVIGAAAAAAGVLGAAGFAVGAAPWSHAFENTAMTVQSGHPATSAQQGDFLFKAITGTGYGKTAAGPQLDVFDSANTAGRTGVIAVTANKSAMQQVTAAAAAKKQAVKQQPAKARPAKRPAKPRAAKPRRVVAAKPYYIYDSVSPGALPTGRNAAVYVNGRYATSWSHVRRHRSVLWIDVNGRNPHAEVLDVEPGDATPAGAAVWVKRRLSWHSNAIAIIYTMRSEWRQVRANVATLPPWMRSRVRYWIADPTGVPHVVPGANATQWYWGRNYDVTLANPGFRH